jgi:hypothetical protein
MYDYLAKVILLGPSGSGKSVRPPIARLTRHFPDTPLRQIMPLAPVREV